MRTILTSAILLLSLAGIAQTKPGFYAVATARTIDVVKTPTVGYVGAEFGYMGSRVGLTIGGFTDSHFQTEKISAVTIKGHLRAFTVSNLDIVLGVEAAKIINKPKWLGAYAYTGDLGVTVPLGKRFVAKPSVLAFYHQENGKWMVCNPGAQIGFGYRL